MESAASSGGAGGQLHAEPLVDVDTGEGSGLKYSGLSRDIVTDIPLTYAPVTRRISRAKKGRPLHCCDICRPKKTFTRAEHLRRHQLSHQLPAYPCTIGVCTRAFHRPDLLASHLYQHETQGEKPFRSGNPRGSRACSTDLNDDPLLQKSAMSNVYSSALINDIQPSEGSPRVYDNENSPALCAVAEADRSFSTEESLYFKQEAGEKAAAFATSDSFQDFRPLLVQQPHLPLLRIPEEKWIPGLSYNNSPWRSVGSDSTFSVYSSDASPPSPPLRAVSAYNRPRFSNALGRASSFLAAESSEEVLHKRESITARPSPQDEKLGTPLLDIGLNRVFPTEISPAENYLSTKLFGLAAGVGGLDSNPADSDHTLQGVDTIGDEKDTGASPKRLLKAIADAHGDEQRQTTTVETEAKECDINSLETPSTEIHIGGIPEHPNAVLRQAIHPVISSSADGGASSILADVDTPWREDRTAPIDIPTSEDSSSMLDTCQLDSCSEITSSANISVGFETDSTESDDRAGDEENHLVTLPSASDVLRAMEDLQFGSVFVEEEAVFRTVLTPVMETLLDSIMTDFWTIFNQEWSANLRKCGGTPSSSSSVSMNAQAASQGPQQTTVSNSQKRLRDDADRPEDEDCNDPKRHRSSVNPSEIADFNLKLACPYRKHNPRTYNHCTKAWRLCALTSFGTIARLKGHLYRHHRIFECERCKELFGDRAKLQTHHMAIKACEVTETKSHDGITCAMECQLKSRKKSSGNETQEESWKVIYAILFPMQAIPSPYFEMIHEETPRSPNSSLLSSYEEFSRQQLPRVFRSALETAIGTERQLAEDRLRNRLISMIQECQDRVFSLYRSQQSDASSTPPPSQQSGEGPGILQSSYGAPPYQDDGSSMPNVPNSTAYSSLASSNESRASDSGYSSEYPALKSSTDNFSHERSAIPTDVTRHPFDECIADSTDNPQNFDPFENYLNTSGNCPSNFYDPTTFLEGASGNLDRMDTYKDISYDPLAYFKGFQDHSTCNDGL